MSEVRVLAAHEVDAAVAVLRAGGLVGLPTETVYGLAADADSADAVARIYAVKGRPQDHPVIVHISGADKVVDWASDFPSYAQQLAAAFWPGPMTLILRRNQRAHDFVTGGQDTVGLRVPNHPVALAVLSGFGGGVAAPSANQFGAVSPTSAAHVLADLGERLDPHRDVIIDGGDSSVGVESTIIDCTGEQPRILRPGAITSLDVERVTGLNVSAMGEAIKAPGTLDSHYAPDATVRLVDTAEQLDEVVAALAHHQFVGVLAPEVVQTPRGAIRLSMPQSNLQYAEELYAALREADRLGLAHVVALLPSGDDIAIAVRDRLTRAAHS